MKNKGFTLIELLVVIAIIGILSSVVLASLNSARSKGNDAAIKAQLEQLRTQAELSYDNHGGNYSSVCSDVSATIAVGVTNAGGTNYVCNPAATAWAAQAQLKSTSNFWCVDSTGKTESTATALGSATTCTP